MEFNINYNFNILCNIDYYCVLDTRKAEFMEFVQPIRDKEKIGTHTLRKTFGYHAYNSGYDIELIQKLFNHSALSITLRYIGITQDDMDDVYLNLDL